MKPKLIFLVIFTCFFIAQNFAQDKSEAKFGKISPKDFERKVYSIDSSASAVIIADIGDSYFEGNEDGWFTFFHKRFRRVHILNQNGYDAASTEIYLYTEGGNDEEIQSLKATTYNLENGKVVETKLDNKSIFKDKLDKYRVVKKFTFPNVKAGSILEFSYTIKSPYLNHIDPWLFQGEFPVLWSELNFQIPEFFNYIFITEGYQPFYNKQPPTNITRSFDVTVESIEPGKTLKREVIKIPAKVYNHKWVMKDVPALKLENFTSSLRNHISKIEFQLKEHRNPLQYKPIMQTWEMLASDLLSTEYFGLHLDKSNTWLNDEIKKIIVGMQTESEKAKGVYEYIRDNFTCTDYNAVYMGQTLKNVLKAKKGSVAEINLLLVAMMKYAGLSADPILLSTKKHGYTSPLYPLLAKFNYVIACVRLDGKDVFLDAAYPNLGFGYLLPDCYNGHARKINREAAKMEFSSDSLTEKKITSVFIVNDKYGKMKADVQQVPGRYESYKLREEINKTGMDEYFKKIKQEYLIDPEITNTGIDSLEKFEDPVSLHYRFTFLMGNDDIIYFSPMLAEGYKENPFKSAVRLYPVEMPYKIDMTYIFQMDTPEGFVVDELPKPMVVKLNDQEDGLFEYRISESGGTISLRSRVKFKRSMYAPEEYELLREFFNLIVDKQGEQIVFKKKK